MPASILMTLMIWSSLVASAIKVESTHLVAVDRPAFQAIDEPWTPFLLASPDPGTACWVTPDADLEEEEDGEPDGLVADSCWGLLPQHGQTPASPIRSARGLVPSSTRLQILRC